jgi:hypothetical protein
MALRLIYQMFSSSWAGSCCAPDLTVGRRSISGFGATSLFVLRRGTPRPRTIWSAALIAALTRLPPGSRRLGLLDHSQSR